MLPDLVGDLLVAQVEPGAQARLQQKLVDLGRIAVRLAGDGADRDLDGREPERKMAGEILDEDAEEALHRAANGTMDHHRRLLLAVAVDIEGAEPLRQVEVDLRRAALPVAADGVAQDIFEFRTVEGAFAGIDAGLRCGRPIAPEMVSSTSVITASARSQSASAPTRLSGRVDSLTTISSKPKSA